MHNHTHIHATNLEVNNYIFAGVTDHELEGTITVEYFEPKDQIFQGGKKVFFCVFFFSRVYSSAAVEQQT